MSATGSRPTLMLDLLVEHLEELDFLWTQRQSILESPTRTLENLADLDQRIGAHLEGLLVGDEDAVLRAGNMEVAGTGLSFPAAFALLHFRTAKGAGIVLEAFKAANGPSLDALRDALSHSPIDSIAEDVRHLAATAPAPVAVAALEVLVRHFQRDAALKRLEQFLTDENPTVRRTAWRITGQTGAVQNQPLFESAFVDADPLVRRESYRAAGWTRKNYGVIRGQRILSVCKRENLDTLTHLALLGGVEMFPSLLALLRRTDLGPGRFELVAIHGRPGAIDDLIHWIENPDVRTAIAAGHAFTRLTGRDIDSDRRIQIPPEDGHQPDEFEKEFLEESKLPDPKIARDHWAGVKIQLSGFARINRGFDLGPVATPAVFDRLDLQSRSEAYLRAKFEGKWQGGPFDLERFPQTKPSPGGSPRV